MSMPDCPVTGGFSSQVVIFFIFFDKYQKTRVEWEGFYIIQGFSLMKRCGDIKGPYYL